MPADSTLHRIFCQNLKSVRAAKGLTQTQVSERLGISQPQYAKIEMGSNVPTLITVERLSVALGVSVGALLDTTHVPAVA